jgi:hypothetical protein
VDAPDQGNRYELAGVVADIEVLAPLAEVHPAAVLVPLDAADLGLVPVTDELAAAVTPAMICAVLEWDIVGGPESTGRASAALHTGPESGFEHLTPGLLSLVEAVSAAGPVAYLEADYTGFDGYQTAAVWRHGALLLGPLLLGRTEQFVPGERRSRWPCGSWEWPRAAVSTSSSSPGWAAADEPRTGSDNEPEVWRGPRLGRGAGAVPRRQGGPPARGRLDVAGRVGEDESLTVSQRLWRADVTRAELEVALDILGDRPPATAAVGFSEELRRYYSGGPQVQPTCSRTPNLCAVILTDLGHLDAGRSD